MVIFQLVVVICVLGLCRGIGRWDVFSTKTAYKWAHQLNHTADSNYKFSVGSLTCKAIHVNMVSRHGARWPSDSDMEDIEKVYRKIIESKPSSTFPALNTWSNRYNLTDESMLLPLGMAEQRDIGAGVGLRFKSLFDRNGQHVQFLSSDKARTKDSSMKFYEGLAGVIPNMPDYSVQVNDSIIRFYDECERYEHSIESNSNMKEHKDFTESETFRSVIRAVQTRLGTSSNLTVDDVFIINDLCAFEKYIFGEETWCDLLTDQERLVLDYGQDIENFYETSYGNQMNLRIACPLIRDMFTTMDRVVNMPENGDPKMHGYLAGKFYTGHSETILPLMTALGLYKDATPLLASNMAEMTGRVFQTSQIAPMSANLAFVVYACDDVSTATEPTFRVRMLVNEKPVEIPVCGYDQCSYSLVRKEYANLIEGCNRDYLCNHSSTSAAYGLADCVLGVVILAALIVVAVSKNHIIV